MRQGWTGTVKYRIAGEEQIRSLEVGDAGLIDPCPADDGRIRISPEWIEGEGYSMLTYRLEPTVPVYLESARFSRRMDSEQIDTVGVNGFQSWSESREYGRKETMHGLRRIFTPWIRKYGLKNYGDYSFSAYRPGLLHGYSWFYLRGPAGIRFLGSFSERIGYTRFLWSWNTSRLVVERECEGLKADGPVPLLQLIVIHGSPEEVFEKYFRLRGVESSAPPLSGWTSWYRHYTGITEEIVRDNLQAFADLQIPADVFQIDDGWERAVGDWLETDENFPSGMGVLAEEVRQAGYRPGLWLAPFIAEEYSHVFQRHPDWFIPSENGRPYTAGYNPFQWKGNFYSLDIYRSEVQDYLREVFHQVIEVWNYRFLKLDFLYAAALLPREGRSRGMVMDDAMQLLDKLCGRSTLLGCGVPLESALGRVRYCRIGADVALKWEDRTLKLLGYRERVSTINSLRSTIGRRHLNHRAFVNDPDVYILRKDRNELSPEQRYTLFLVNQIYGGLLFTSDNPAEYDPETLDLYFSQFPLRKKDIIEADEGYVRFRIGTLEYAAYHNLTGKNVTHDLPKGLYYSSRTGFFSGGPLILKPYQSRCFLLSPDRPYSIAGSTGMLFPGSEVESWEAREGNIEFTVHPDTRRSGRIMVRMPLNADGCTVNGTYMKAEEKVGMKLLLIPRA